MALMVKMGNGKDSVHFTVDTVNDTFTTESGSMTLDQWLSLSERVQKFLIREGRVAAPKSHAPRSHGSPVKNAPWFLRPWYKKVMPKEKSFIND